MRKNKIICSLVDALLGLYILIIFSNFEVIKSGILLGVVYILGVNIIVNSIFDFFELKIYGKIER